MPTLTHARPNALGDLRAEADSEMLGNAFLETADYRTLIETSDRLIIVGRRGTGKSALTLSLEKYFHNAHNTHVVKIAPEEHQMIGLRPLAQMFGEKFLHIRAGTRLVWRHALMMEAAKCLSVHREVVDSDAFLVLQPHLEKWNSLGSSVVERFKKLLKSTSAISDTPEGRIGELTVALNLTQIQDALSKVSSEKNALTVFLIDRLDEGYEPDDIGVGLVDGLLQAAIDVKTRVQRVRPIVFLRDNIFRTVQSLDQDFSRTIEGQVLRLHWDEHSLLDFSAKRLQLALSIREDSSQKIWNSCVTAELRGPNGFAKCLRQTLYRPRDLLALLNNSIFAASKRNLSQVSIEVVDETAKEISQNRLDDLRKEYGAILPGLHQYLSVFQGKDPEIQVGVLSSWLEDVLASGSENSLIQQDFFILEDAKSVVRGLYSVGFLGVKDQTTGTFVFCHDGRSPDREFSIGDSVLIHPCYWMALNCTKNHLDPEQAQDIYDEYDIEVSSETPNIRNQKITNLIQQLEQIPEGNEGDSQFENWCAKAIRICFAKSLRNVELHPNKLAKMRRDVVATNLGENDAWRRIRDDYGTRQVIFEVKNYKSISAADYQQVNSYLSGEYGRLGFIVTRDDSVDLFADRDVEWVREMYLSHRTLIIKVTGKYLTKLLYKLRNPERHNDIDDSIHKLLDTYTRLYLSGQTKTQAIADRREKKRAERAAKRIAKRNKGSST